MNIYFILYIIVAVVTAVTTSLCTWRWYRWKYPFGDLVATPAVYGLFWPIAAPVGLVVLARDFARERNEREQLRKLREPVVPWWANPNVGFEDGPAVAVLYLDGADIPHELWAASGSKWGDWQYAEEAVRMESTGNTKSIYAARGRAIVGKWNAADSKERQFLASAWGELMRDIEEAAGITAQ